MICISKKLLFHYIKRSKYNMKEREREKDTFNKHITIR